MIRENVLDFSIIEFLMKVIAKYTSVIELWLTCLVI